MKIKQLLQNLPGLNASDHLPLHTQVYRLLRDLIESSEILPGDQLLSERGMANLYGISRAPVRQAYITLARDGLIEMRPREGVFVLSPKYYWNLACLGFCEMPPHITGKVLTLLLAKYQVPADARLAQQLQVSPETSLNMVQRLRLLPNDIPLGLETSYLPHTFFPTLLDCDLVALSLHEILQDFFDTRLNYAEERITAALPDADEARLLGCDTPVALLKVERRLYDMQHRIVEYTVGLYHSERYDLRLKLERA